MRHAQIVSGLQAPILILVCMIGLGRSGQAATVFFGPSPYLSSADSLPGATIEDFEDGLLNTPGISVSGGVIGGCPSATCDSVDGDDGSIDGSGNAGQSWYGNVVSLTFTFDETVLGSLPLQAGIVWTDVGFGGGFFAPVTFEAFGPGGVSLGTIVPASELGDGSDAGQTAEDRFFGVFNSAGVSAISLTTDNFDWEVDHVQYSFVPGPSSVFLLLLGSGVVAFKRRLTSGA